MAPVIKAVALAARAELALRVALAEQASPGAALATQAPRALAAAAVALVVAAVPRVPE
jgi:hypothetical protein